jgi:hypothetical protein
MKYGRPCAPHETTSIRSGKQYIERHVIDRDEEVIRKLNALWTDEHAGQSSSVLASDSQLQNIAPVP